MAPDELVARLRDAGAEVSLADLDAVIDGVNAAPTGHDPAAWLTLIGAELPTDLAAALEARRTARQAPVTAGDPAARLAALRARLAQVEVDGFLIPRADEFLGEYIAAQAERLFWLTGFNGSAGLAVVTADTAAIFTDGRYTLQVRDQVDTTLYETHHITDSPATAWLKAHLPAGGRLGYDPWLHTRDGLARYDKALADVGATTVALTENPIDAVWADQPPPPLTPMFAHDLAFTGRTSADKRHDLAEQLAAAGHDAFVLTSPESIAWLLNVRGGDVPRTPLSQAFAVLHKNGAVDLYVDPRKVTAATRGHLGNEVSVAPRDQFGAGLDILAGRGAVVGVDAGDSPVWVWQRLVAAGATPVADSDPVVMPRACKNPIELAGMVAAHERDGLAICRFLAWLDRTSPGTVSEIDAARKLADFRAEGAHFRDLSFDTISGTGPNGAIVHYRVSPQTNRVLAAGDLYLVDSGGQYLDGTTDITRTIAIGPPGAVERDRFTRVLKGHIAIATAVFPTGTNGAQLDVLARAALWRVGIDYDHGTGHGVGAYLGVHEGPHRISKGEGAPALRAGMVVSNEPGYYKTGAFGIRIENLVTVVDHEIAGGERAMLAFETLTLAPIDRRLIDAALLTGEEIAWLDAYHARVWAAYGTALTGADRDWLAAATAPL